MKTVSVIAATVYGNRGAEAMLEAAIGRLRDRWPDAKFNVFSYYPRQDRLLVTDPSVTIYSAKPLSLVFVHLPFALALWLCRKVGLHGAVRIMPAAVRALAQSDALIDLAGVSFIDGREKYLPFNVLTILPAMLVQVPVFKLSQAMGPFTHSVNRVAAGLLRRCALVVARGETTRHHLEELGCPSRIVIEAPDVAFGFEARDSLSREGASEVAGLRGTLEDLSREGSLVIGICPSSVIAGKAVAEKWSYSDLLAAVATAMLTDGHAVVLFPNATRAEAGDALRNNDLPVIRQVMSRLQPHVAAGRVHAVTGDMCAAHLRSVVECCDCAVVSRFHAMVAALSAGVPVLVLGWSHKYREVMAQFGLETWTYDYREHDAESLVSQVRGLVEAREELAAQIAAVLPSVQMGAVKQFEEVSRRVAGPGGSTALP